MEIYNINRKEIRHTSFLKWLFEPTNQIAESAIIKLIDIVITSKFFNGNKYRDDLVNTLIIGNYEIDYWKVVENHNAKGGIVDLYIKAVINKMTVEIIIENKVLSNEHDDQTQRYYDFFSKSSTNSSIFFIYLTPLSSIKLDELVEPECCCKEYIQINYQQIVDGIIEVILLEEIDSTTKYILEDYLKALSTPVNTNQDKHRYMAISSKESELLTRFWEENEDLILKAVEATKENTHIEPEKREVARKISEIMQSDQNEKIGAYVKRNLKELFFAGKITSDEIERFQDTEFSKNVFDIRYPLLKKVESRNDKPIHYWKDIININNEEFYLCCEWFENENNNDRVFFDNWLKTKKQ
jgi:hypothetical protein